MVHHMVTLVSIIYPYQNQITGKSRLQQCLNSIKSVRFAKPCKMWNYQESIPIVFKLENSSTLKTVIKSSHIKHHSRMNSTSIHFPHSCKLIFRIFSKIKSLFFYCWKYYRCLLFPPLSPFLIPAPSAGLHWTKYLKGSPIKISHY